MDDEEVYTVYSVWDRPRQTSDWVVERWVRERTSSSDESSNDAVTRSRSKIVGLRILEIWADHCSHVVGLSWAEV